MTAEDSMAHLARIADRGTDEPRCTVCGCSAWFCLGTTPTMAAIDLARAGRAALAQLPEGPHRDALVAALAPIEGTYPSLLRASPSVDP